MIIVVLFMDVMSDFDLSQNGPDMATVFSGVCVSTFSVPRPRTQQRMYNVVIPVPDFTPTLFSESPSPMWQWDQHWNSAHIDRWNASPAGCCPPPQADRPTPVTWALFTAMVATLATSRYSNIVHLAMDDMNNDIHIDWASHPVLGRWMGTNANAQLKQI
jgi:hypothetical protein